MAEPIYRDGRHYDRQQENYTKDIAFYLEQAKQFGQPILELACGTGRITIPIAQQGLEIVGIDQSESMLERAKQKSGSELPITWRQGDIRSFVLKQKFKMIFLPFNSIAHLYDLKSVSDCFQCVRKHLDDDGRFLLDFFNPNLNFLTRDDDPPRFVSEYPDPDSDNIVVITETNRYDRATQINHIHWHYQIGDNSFLEELNMRIFYPQELDALLAYNGFTIENKYGGFDMSPFTSDSEEQAFICKLAGN
ncbi:MAG: class I SAM-dependent methyltransferase [bacterium]|nr:MAG: class I SAM-dependent methyltransferase [bacterium]